MQRRAFLSLSVGAASGTLTQCAREEPPVEVADYTTLDQLSSLMRAGKITAGDVTGRSLGRIAKDDRAGQGIRAIIELNPEATAIASAMDDERKAQKARSALHGLPILIKDNIDTADGMETTAGSLALMGSKPAHDAFIVKRLREAGMVLLGKTNLSEWANIRSPNSTSGWSARGGLTRNPHRTTHSASGSSSGSAAAVAAGLAPAAIGTETNGSIISPASACGIVGLKPTVGLVSRSGIIPITHWQDTAGPMTLTVRDAALLMNVLAGSDANDAQSGEADARRVKDYTAELSTNALGGKRLGILRSESGKNTQVLAAFDQAVEALKSAGAIIIDDLEMPNRAIIGRASFTAMLVELREDLNAYLAARGAGIKSLKDVIAFNEAHREDEMPHFGQEFFLQAEKLGTAKAIKAGREAREQARRLAGPEGIDALLAAHQLDALICPTNDPTGIIDLSKGDADGRVASTPAAVAGYPHLTVPMGMIEGLPVGLSFMGRAWSESALLAMGHAFEQVMPARRAPAM